MGSPLRILFLESSPNDAELVHGLLAEEGFTAEVRRVETRDDFVSALTEGGFDLILSEHSLPSFTGLSALSIAQWKRPDIPFIFVSRTTGEEIAVEAIQHGAADYVLKQHLARLGRAVRRALAKANEQAQLKQAEMTLRLQVYYDPLTGLPNRALIQNRIEKSLKCDLVKGTVRALLLINLDRFREINDAVGYHNGDIVLKVVGQRMTEMRLEAATVARLGGDEFAILLQADREEVARIAGMVLDRISQPVVREGVPIAVRASLGIALSPDHGTDTGTLLRRANVAMRVAKKAGSGIAIYAPEQDQKFNPERLALMGELHQAIERDELCLHYQPKVDLHTTRISGCEALVRWQHPQRGLLPPGQFISLAEQSGLIKPLTQWALKAAVCQCQAWQQTGIECPVTVNLSVRNLQDTQLPDQLTQLLSTHGVAADRLGLEITESFIMADPARALEVLTRLRNMGLKLSIDDFGTGYSSLGYLKTLPVQEIKIDKSFVMTLMKDRHNAAIVRAAVDLGHSLNRTVTAEGVEDQGTWHGLVALGCDVAQGYYFSRPIPGEAFVRWLGESPYGSGHSHMAVA